MCRQVSIQAASVSVDYDFCGYQTTTTICLPIGAQVILKKGRAELDRNEIEFHNYRRFSSNMKVLNLLLP